MSYGLTFINTSDVVTLDSEFARLVVLSAGRYSGGASFSSVVTTPEPPLVFVRPDSSYTFQYASVSGSPGNWTGFTFLGSGAGKYFAAAFQSRELANFGMRLWDGGSKILFDSGTPCAQFTRTITSWTYAGSSTTEQGLTRMNWTATSPLDSGDYMLINTIGMNVAGQNRSSRLYCSLSYASNSVNPFVIGVGDYPTNGFFIPIIFAKPIS